MRKPKLILRDHKITKGRIARWGGAAIARAPVFPALYFPFPLLLSPSRLPLLRNQARSLSVIGV